MDAHTDSARAIRRTGLRAGRARSVWAASTAAASLPRSSHGTGTSVVVYRPDGDAWRRDVIDESLTDGHTLVVGDFDGDGRDEFVAGARRGARVTLYRASSNGDAWSRQVLDEGGVAAAGCAVADFNLDGRLDLACIGSGTANLKWYENATGR